MHDLRGRVQLAVKSASDLAGQAKAIQELTDELDHSSAILDRKLRTERAYSAITPAALERQVSSSAPLAVCWIRGRRDRRCRRDRPVDRRPQKRPP